MTTITDESARAAEREEAAAMGFTEAHALARGDHYADLATDADNRKDAMEYADIATAYRFAAAYLASRALRGQGEAVAPVRIHAMTADDRVVRVLAEHPVVMTVAGELTRFLKEQEAANYIELRLTDANDGQEYALLIQRVGGETPAQQAQRLKDELATLTHPVPSQQGGFGAAALAEVAAGCPCLRCIRERGDKSGGLPLEYTMMIVCVICGNKRCPHSDDHRNPCTNSNEPGQHGSRYGGLAAPSPKKQEEGK